MRTIRMGPPLLTNRACVSERLGAHFTQSAVAVHPETHDLRVADLSTESDRNKRVRAGQRVLLIDEVHRRAALLVETLRAQPFA